MKPREKAENLVEMFMNIEPNKLSDYSRIYHPTAKQFALIVVNEVLESHKRDYELNESKTYWHPYDYWQNVKDELEKL